MILWGLLGVSFMVNGVICIVGEAISDAMVGIGIDRVCDESNVRILGYY